MRRASRGRVLLYSHDTYGLGHLRRCLLIAERLAVLPEAPTVLIATGSPRAQAFDLPQRCDTLKLPAVLKTPAGTYRPRSLSLPLPDLLRIRSDLLRSAAASFRPDVILVDHAPMGVRGELEPLFEEVDRWAVRPRVVLGLRDVIDEAHRVRAEWTRLGAWDALDRVYDRVLVYGDPAVLTTAHELGLPSRYPGKVRFAGYLGRSLPAAHPAARSDPRILVTAGGGGDGQNVMRAYAAFLESSSAPAPFRSVVVTGPFLSDRRRCELAARFRPLGDTVDVLPYVDRMERLLPQMAGVVSMAGYNTVAEILSARVPALLVPRERPRREQAIRADRLGPPAGLEVCPADRLRPGRIAAFVEGALSGSIVTRAPVRLDGLDRTAEELSRLLGTASPPRAGARPGEVERVASPA